MAKTVYRNSKGMGGISRSRVLLFVMIVIAGLLLLMLFSGNNPKDKSVGVLKNGSDYHLASDQDGNGVINKIEQILSIKQIPLTPNGLISDKSGFKKSSAIDEVPPIVSSNDNNAGIISTTLPQQYHFTEIDKKYLKHKAEQKFVSLDAKMLVYNVATLTSQSSASLHHSLPVNNYNTGKYKLEAGSVIPATMINGINSDLVGQVIAQVRQNVYDSVSGKHILIPQGAKLIGLYDSNIAFGQERLIVIWNRLIYPSGKSIMLHAMPGTDLAGYQGFHDIVDNKYSRIFGMSFIMGVISGAMQYSQNSIVNTNNYSSPTVGQTMASSLGQQLGQTGLAIANKNLNVSPTLIIRPNYPFNIMLTSDLDLYPYKPL